MNPVEKAHLKDLFVVGSPISTVWEAVPEQCFPGAGAQPGRHSLETEMASARAVSCVLPSWRPGDQLGWESRHILSISGMDGVSMPGFFPKELEKGNSSQKTQSSRAPTFP